MRTRGHLRRRFETVLTLSMLLVIGWSLPGSAQTVVDPHLIAFDASPDHFNLMPDSQPLVQRYELSVFALGSGTPFNVVDLGKPQPDANGVIQITLPSSLASPWVPGMTYSASVSAVGPGGASSSSYSNPFTFSTPCSDTVSSTSASFTATGGAGSVNIISSAGCTWSASTTASWLTLTNTGGTGSQVVNFTVASNSSSTRVGTLNIGHSVVTVTQAGVPPAISSVTASPNPIITGQKGTLTVNGINFNPAMVELLLTGPGCAPCTMPNAFLTTKTASQVVASVVPTTPGTYTLSVRNGAGGQVSNGQSISVGNPILTITGVVTASSPLVNGKVGTITINGSNFNPSTVQLLITGPGCGPCTVPNSVLTTKTPTQLFTYAKPILPGTYFVSVQNGPGTGASNGLYITVVP